MSLDLKSLENRFIERSFLYKKQAPGVVDAFLDMVPAPDGPVQAHDGGYGSIDFFRGFFLVCLDVSGRVSPDVDVIHHPSKDGMPSMSNSLLQRELHKLLGRRAHVLESLSEGNYEGSCP